MAAILKNIGHIDLIFHVQHICLNVQGMSLDDANDNNTHEQFMIA